MKLNLKRIQASTCPVDLAAWPRIFPARHAATPTEAGFGASRFSSPSKAFRVLYSADTFPAALAESVVRDRFVGKTRRYLYQPFLESLVASEIRTKHSLRMVDLTGSGAYDLGVDTDAKGARAHDLGQAFAEALHATTMVDGILFSSRFTGSPCVAIFDRAFPALTATTPVELRRIAALAPEISRLGVTIRRRRAVA